MFKFLKKIFQNGEKETKKAAELSLQGLEEWLNEKAKPLMEEMQQQIGEILMKVDEESQKARFNVEVLENAKLQNSNIPFKAKQYMEGNRKAYIRAINSFIGKMEINNRDYFYLLDFCRLFDELINDLNRSTFRSYTILQEFFANETGKIAQNLKNFDAIFSEMKSILNNKRMTSVNAARDKIQNLKAKAKQKINLDVDFKSIEADAKLDSDGKNSVMAKIDEFNKSEDHMLFLELNEDKKTKAANFYNDESRILQSFSILERALRKYSHIAFEHEEIVLEYLKQPIEALADDKNLEILEVLKSLERMLQDNRLQVDDRKKEKSLEEIKKLNKEFIDQFLKKYFSFRAEMEELESRIKASGVPKKFKNFSEQLEEINLRIEKDNSELSRLKNEVSKSANSVESLKNEIESDVKTIFGEEIKVVF